MRYFMIFVRHRWGTSTLYRSVNRRNKGVDKELELIYKLRRVLVDMNPVEAMELLTTRLKKVKSNAEFLMTMNLA